jgi:hypothetical protein
MSRRAVAALVVLCAVCIWAGAHAAEADGAGSRLEARDGDFTVYYRAGEERAARVMLDVAASRGREVARRAGLAALGPVRIYVAGSDDEFRELTFGGVPDWGAGCAFPDRGVIVLRNPVTVPDPLHMEDVVVHEVAHIAAGRVLGDVRVPRWFHEGIAMTLAGEWRLPISASLASAGPSGELFPLSELAGRFPSGSGEAMLAYTESFHAVRYLMDEAGPATPAELLHGIAAAGFEGGIRGLTGRTLAEFEEDAVASFRTRFGWGVFLTRWNVLFAALTVLVLAGGLLRLARGRRLLRQWEEEERARATGGRRRSGSPDSGWN